MRSKEISLQKEQNSGPDNFVSGRLFTSSHETTIHLEEEEEKRVENNLSIYETGPEKKSPISSPSLYIVYVHIPTCTMSFFGFP